MVLLLFNLHSPLSIVCVRANILVLKHWSSRNQITFFRHPGHVGKTESLQAQKLGR